MIRIEVGNRYYDETQWAQAWLSSWWRNTPPIFHKVGDWRSWRGEVMRGWDISTQCGLTIREATWVIDNHSCRTDRERGYELPLRYAVSFGRPCKRCWP